MSSKIKAIEHKVSETLCPFKESVVEAANEIKKSPSDALVMFGVAAMGAGVVTVTAGLMEQVVSYGVSQYGEFVARKCVETGGYVMGGGFVVMLSGLSVKAGNFVLKSIKRN
jgi:hypothetical protein